MPANKKVYATKTVCLKNVLFGRGDEVKGVEITQEELKSFIEKSILSYEKPVDQG